MNDDFALSQLLSGELPEAEAEALRARIAAEPALARRWAQMQALPGALASLPRALTPPAPAAIRRSWPRAVAAAATVALLAASVAFAFWPEPPVVHLLSGSSLVEGRTTLLTGAGRVEIDGRARVSVEPGGDLMRVEEAEWSTMSPSHLGAAIAGALVTVAVYEGSARIFPTEATEPLNVGEGESRSVGTPPEAAPPAAEPQNLAEARSTIAKLRSELAQAQTRSQLEAARLATHEGTPQAWPRDLPEEQRPAGFEARVRAEVANIPGAEVAAVDCEEYPCVAVITTTSTAGGWVETLGQAHSSLAESQGVDAVGVIGMGASNAEDGEPGTRAYAFALMAAPASPEVQTRTEFRARDLLSEHVGPPPDPEEGGD